MSSLAGPPILSVVCAVIRQRGRFLVARRLPSPHQPAGFEFPGGKIHPGETPDQAVRREIAEELGLNITPLEQGPSLRQPLSHRIIELIPLLCVHPTGTIRLTDHSEIRWMRPPQWTDLDWLEADRRLIARLDWSAWLRRRAPPRTQPFNPA